MPSLPGPWRAILAEARAYPSPHNAQPIKVAVIDDQRTEFYYDLDLGLPAENFGIPFGHVCAGSFVESVAVVAAGHGYALDVELNPADLDFTSAERLHHLGTLTLHATPVTASAQEQLAAFRRRRTSRRPYDATLVDPAVLDAVTAVTADGGHTFAHTDDPALVSAMVTINQTTLFDDLRNDAVHAEILTWLRTSRRHARVSGDGLSAETMLMPGPLLRFAMQHRGLWEAPVIGKAFQTMYLNTMRGVRQLGWLTGPFAGPLDYVQAGRTFLGAWLAFTQHDVYLHPFGTVITNPRSHSAFAAATGAVETEGQMAWMLFRFGHSRRPPLAYRRPLSAMIIGAQP